MKNWRGKLWKQSQILFYCSAKLLWTMTAARKLKDTYSLEGKKYLSSVLKSRGITLQTKLHIVKAMVFQVVIHVCDSWTTKNAECWRTDAFELWWWRRLLRVPWIARRSNQSILKEISPWIFTGRIDAKAEAPTLWPPGVTSQLIGKDSDAEKDWRQEKKGTTEDGMVGWHHQHVGREFERALAVGDGQGRLACCSPCCHKELVMTEWLNWTELTLTEREVWVFVSISSFWCLHLMLEQFWKWNTTTGLCSPPMTQGSVVV